MPECVGCRQGVAPPDPALRGPGGSYHLGCAPAPLLEAAIEEHAAIVRKGVRYFVEKYDGSAEAAGDWGARFVALGSALDRERQSRSSR